jgi:branched-chain amino acid transport system permease protein
MYVDYELLLTLLGVNAIGALGYYFTFSSGQLSMAHGAMFLLGGYAGGYLTATFDLPVVLALVVGFLVPAAIGAGLALALHRTRGLYFAVATLAFGGVVVEGVKHFPMVGGAFGLGGIPNFTTLPVVLVVLVVVVVAIWAFDRSPLRIAHAAARVDQDAAVVLGIDVRRTRGFAFAVGAGLAGVAGVLYAGSTTIITPTDGDFAQSLAFLLMVVIGGAHSWRGPLVGAAVWIALPELLRATDEWRMVVFGIAAIALMIWRPQGIVPRRIFRPHSRNRRSRRLGRGARPTGGEPAAGEDRAALSGRQR